MEALLHAMIPPTHNSGIPFNVIAVIYCIQYDWIMQLDTYQVMHLYWVVFE